MPDSPTQSTTSSRLRQLAFSAFLLCAGVWLVALIGNLSLAQSGWFHAIFLVVAMAATLLALNRALPIQNVLAVAAVIGVLSGLTVILDVNYAIPFGPVSYSDTLVPQIFGVPPWTRVQLTMQLMPLIWILAILNSRGVARLILRPWRKVSRYGYWTFGLTVALTVLFDFNLEPFATNLTQWWFWRAPTALAWYSAPWTNFLGWTATTIVILAFATPWLINKHPSRHSAPDYQPLAIWLALNLIPAVACATHQLWWPAGLALLASGIVTYFAIKGARW